MLTNMGDRAKSISIDKIDISTDADLNAEYGLTIPVVLVDGDVIAESRIDIPEIRKVIEQKIE